MRRPLQHLYPLEITHPSTEERAERTVCESELETQTTTNGNCEIVERNDRPLRYAAKKAQDNVRAIALHEQELE